MAELWDSPKGAPPPHLEGSLHEVVTVKQGAQESGMPGMEQNCLRKRQHGMQVAELEGWGYDGLSEPEMPRYNEQQVWWFSSMVLLLFCMIFLCRVLVPPFWSGHTHHCIVQACNFLSYRG